MPSSAAGHTRHSLGNTSTCPHVRFDYKKSSSAEGCTRYWLLMLPNVSCILQLIMNLEKIKLEKCQTPSPLSKRPAPVP